MEDAHFLQLIKLLPRENYTTSKELANKFGVTSRTIRNRLNELSILLEQHGATIEMKPRFGVRLIITNEDDFKLFLNNLEIQSNKMPNSQEERVQYLLDYLLNELDRYVKIDELANQLYVSRTTINIDLKVVRDQLNEHNIKLEKLPKKGLKIEGKEFDIRMCIAHNSSKTLLKKSGFSSKIDRHEQIKEISKILNRIFEKNDFVVSGIAYQNLISHLFIAVNRIKQNKIKNIVATKNVSEIQKEYLREYNIAEEITNELESVYNIVIPDEEIGYITIHLAAKKVFNYKKSTSDNLVISDDTNKIVEQMLDLINQYFSIDFRDDLDLRFSLALHLIPLKVRIEYNMDLENPLLKEIKTRFTLAYTLAVQACSILEKSFDKELSEGEISYFALHFNLALERKKSKNADKNIIIVCSSGRGTAELLSYKFKEKFNDYINKVKTIELQQLESIDFNEFHYIITTVPIPFKVPLPILEINYFLEDDDIRAVKKLFAKSKDDIQKYFDRDLFFVDVNLDTKEEVINFLSNKIINRKKLPLEFVEKVFERENQASTEFGNLIAIPHPSIAFSEETFVSIAILKNPIIWNKKKVQLVYLMSIETNKKKDLQEFYRVTSRFLLSKDHVKNIIKNKNFDYFMKTIDKVKKEIEEV